jgi:dynein regulatory complex subunit 2
MKQYLLQLKSQLVEMQDELRRRLVKLATTCDTVEKQLEKRVKIAETILMFAEMCRKLETEEEKVLPFFVSSLSEEEQAEVEAAFHEQPFEDLAKVIESFV